MIKALLSAALVFGSAAAFAGELDNEGSVTNHSLQGTVVLRVDNRTKATSVMQTSVTPADEKAAQALVKKGKFSGVRNAVRTELDEDGGASSWYWYGYNYGYVQNYGYGYSYNMNYYGNFYRPCYYYNWGSYSYYYYSSWGRWW